MLVRSDLDALIVPLAERLYDAGKAAPNQMYMMLIIILILSQDAAFNAQCHALMLPGVPWYKERLLGKTSLGSLLVVILIRTVKYNLAQLRDVYLHTNCLAALANMAPHASGLSSYAAQRLVSLFQMLAKKYARLAAAPDAESSESPSELSLYADFLQIVLAIINAVLAHALPRNPELVYALLHRQELFSPTAGGAAASAKFADPVDNVRTVLAHFTARMDEAGVAGDWSVDRALELVTTAALKWRPGALKQLKELRFTYEEEAHPEEFFLPYVWSLAVGATLVPWDVGRIQLFAAGQGAQVDGGLDDFGELVAESTPSPAV